MKVADGVNLEMVEIELKKVRATQTALREAQWEMVSAEQGLLKTVLRNSELHGCLRVNKTLLNRMLNRG